MEFGRAHTEIDTIQSRMFFRGLVFDFGIDTVEMLIGQADQAIADNLEGVTMPMDAAEERFAVAIDKERISMRMLDGGVYSLTRASADELLAEIREEESGTNS